MAIKLVKGQRISLKKDAPNLNRILVGLGWDPVKKGGFFGSEEEIDIDASVICIDRHNRMSEVVYFGNLTNNSESIMHHGDNLTGEGDGDDEQIEIILDELPRKIIRLSLIINIYEAHRRRQHFGKVKNCYVHVMDLATNQDLIRYDIEENFNDQTGIFVADLYRQEEEWKFQAIGTGVDASSISDMVKMKCDR